VATVPTLSYSGVRAYAECPLRWKFMYIDHLPETPRGYFTFGRTVHSVLEALLEPLVVPIGRRTDSGRTQRTLADYAAVGTSTERPAVMGEAELRATYDRLWSSEGYLSADDEARYRQLGWGILTRFRDTVAADPPTPIAVEPHLETKWDGIPVHGYIDRVDRTASGGLEIVDYKTSKELSEADARESDQLSLYQVLVEANFPGPVEGLTLFHLRRHQALRSGRRERRDLEVLYDRVGEVYDGIRTEAYEPQPGRHCGRCEFQSRCPEFRRVPDPERDRLLGLADRFTLLREQEQALEGELRAAASELHEAAAHLGVHRVPGSQDVLIRRREEHWDYSGAPARAALRAGHADGIDPGDPHAVRRWLRDPKVPPELRRAVADAGERRERYYWTLQSSDTPPPTNARGAEAKDITVAR
jgi:putative RecB family exonuclease